MSRSVPKEAGGLVLASPSLYGEIIGLAANVGHYTSTVLKVKNLGTAILFQMYTRIKKITEIATIPFSPDHEKPFYKSITMYMSA